MSGFLEAGESFVNSVLFWSRIIKENIASDTKLNIGRLGYKNSFALNDSLIGRMG